MPPEEYLRERIIKPTVKGKAAEAFVARCEEFAAGLRLASEHDRPIGDLVAEFRRCISQYENCPNVEYLKTVVALHVVVDFIALGWHLEVIDGQAKLSSTDETRAAIKARIRQSHLIERDQQLKDPAVVEFVRGMERRRLTKNGWHSIYSLLRDGQDLADRLRPIAAITDDEVRVDALRSVIHPYLQFVEPERVCEHTGLLLNDIWRYFRHTWTNIYRSVPGRSMMILVRDAAVPNHPVIGIAALGSSVVQQTDRDDWIGWTPNAAATWMKQNASAKTVAWLRKQVSAFIDELYLDDIKQDLRKHKSLRKAKFQNPPEELLTYLRQKAAEAIAKHRLEPQKFLHKSIEGGIAETEWRLRAMSYLYVGKRYATLAQLLTMRSVLLKLVPPSLNDEKAIREAFATAALRDVVGQVFRFVKSSAVGINMMDITVCGAIAPYNALLGGKLVSLLLCSPEVVRHYATRYGDQPSVIASCMKGSPVIREPKLVLLCTTSLYGGGSSQYNRLVVPTGAIGSSPEATLKYQEIGCSRAFGSFHLSRETQGAIKVLATRLNHSRRVNSIFGEGVNPLMRKIREGLAGAGLNGDDVLNHGTPRIVYGVPLATNFKEVLLGMEHKPHYILRQSRPHEGTEAIAAFWRRRWLTKRICRGGIFEALASHTLDYPVRHGGLVPMRPDESDSLTLW